ncbi:MAG: hypothetical protein PHU14_14415 [Methylovulum sp.]|nr:hypothetical protein [Methylovulum sp.]
MPLQNATTASIQLPTGSVLPISQIAYASHKQRTLTILIKTGERLYIDDPNSQLYNRLQSRTEAAVQLFKNAIPK